MAAHSHYSRAPGPRIRTHPSPLLHSRTIPANGSTNRLPPYSSHLQFLLPFLLQQIRGDTQNTNDGTTGITSDGEQVTSYIGHQNGSLT